MLTGPFGPFTDCGSDPSCSNPNTATLEATSTSATPEPTSFLLFGTGLLGIVLISRRMLVTRTPQRRIA